MRRLTPLGLLLVSAAGACSDYPVESCPAGQGIVLNDAFAPRLGEADAPVKLELFGDFQCPGTHALWFRLAPFVDRLEADGRSGAFQLRFHHFPLTEIHGRAYAAALASEAAHLQGNDAFWALFPMLLASAPDLDDEDIAAYAAAAGLDTDRFAVDLASPAVAAAVDRDLDLAGALSLPGTPSAILCGVRVSVDPDELLDNLEYLVR